ncbi:unnamed protein product [Lactuca virosa]|uniref:Actin-related protein 9 n=1 Tax=Lactuca virosa TaxID=75947 RepID=A0AAU9MWB9_9ASTR|nr:unnamed protein product [Lactuca virosa]
MDYSKSVIPSHLLADRGSNLVVINPGSGNVRIGLAQQDAPFSIPHCIARRTTGSNQSPRRNVQDQMLNSQVTTSQHAEREKAYDIIASLLKIPFLDEEVVNNSYSRKTGRVDVLSQQNSKKESALTWTDVSQQITDLPLPESSLEKNELLEGSDEGEKQQPQSSECRYREFVCGEEAMRISPTEPYCLRRPIRRGHFNISQHYSMQQVVEDIEAIWDWILIEKLHIPHSERNMYCALIVVPETFDNREIKEILSIVLRDLRFSSAVVHQEGLAAVFGNGLSTACVVNIGAQVTSVICVEDGVALPHTQITLRFGGEDVSRCLLWTQRHHQTWPPVRTDALTKPIDLLMLNRLKESYCQIYEGEVEAVGVVHSYEDGLPPGSHKTRLTALNVAPMGLFYPTLLVPDVYPPPPRSWFKDYEDMLEDTWHISDGSYPEAISKSILSTGRIDLQRKLFCSMQLIGGVALTTGLISAVEERVLHAIPSNEAIDTVEVLQSRTNPSFVAWRGGAILGVIDFVRDAWIHREDWIQNGIHIGGVRKYKDSYYLQAQPMCYINS